MASAKQRAWNAAFGAFVKKHKRAPRKGELRASSGGSPASKRPPPMADTKQKLKNAAAGVRKRIHAKSLAAGALVPPAAAVLTPFLGEHASTAAMATSGIAFENDTLQTLAAVRASAAVVNAVSSATMGTSMAPTNYA